MADIPDPYRGLCASTYDALAPPDAVGDVEFFRSMIAADGEPALEIACGTGRLLLQYVAEGFDIEGIDLSPEMLEICARKARESGLDVTLHRQTMQELDLERRFRTIFVPYFTFQLLMQDEDIAAALQRFRKHLEPAGQLLLPLFLPFEADVGQDAAPEGEWRLRRESADDDGGKIRCWEMASYDFGAQVKHSRLRFEVVDDAGDVIDSEERSLGVRWYTQEQMAARLATAGFTVVAALCGHSHGPAKPDDTSFTFVARP